jgi:hypothetical protein
MQGEQLLSAHAGRVVRPPDVAVVVLGTANAIQQAEEGPKLESRVGMPVLLYRQRDFQGRQAGRRMKTREAFIEPSGTGENVYHRYRLSQNGSSTHHGSHNDRSTPVAAATIPSIIQEFRKVSSRGRQAVYGCSRHGCLHQWRGLYIPLGSDPPITSGENLQNQAHRWMLPAV